MEEYYAKYAKPLDDTSIIEAKSRLVELQNFTREELELLIFLINGIKNETTDRLSQSSKLKLVSLIEQLKSSTVNLLDNISSFLCKIESKHSSEVDSHTYSKIEHIRNDYNKQLKNNHKAIVGKEILIHFKEKFYKMQQIITETKENLNNRNYYNNDINQNSKPLTNRPIISSKMSKFNLNTMRVLPKRNKINNKNSNTLHKKICLNESGINDNNEAKMLNNESSDSESNEYNVNQRPFSNRDKLPPRKPKKKALLNVSDIPQNRATTCPDQFSQIIQIKTDIMIIQDEIKILKGKKAPKIPIKSQVDGNIASQLANQNEQMWGEMTSMKSDINELFNTIKVLNEKLTTALEDNKTIKQENENLKQYIYQSNQTTNQYYPSDFNPANLNSRNNSSSNIKYHHQHPKSNTNYNNDHEKKINSQPLNMQHDTNRYTQVPEYSNNYITTTENEEIA